MDEFKLAFVLLGLGVSETLRRLLLEEVLTEDLPVILDDLRFRPLVW